MDLLLRPDAFCLLLSYRLVVHSFTGRLRWKKMHLCSSRVHHIRHIDMCIEPRHHACGSMCINVLPPYLDQYFNPRSSTSSSIACCVFAPSCFYNHHIKCSKTFGQQEIHRPPSHMNPNSYADLANKTLKTMFIMYEVAITSLLPSMPTYTAKHPQSVLTGIRFTQTDDPTTWSYHWLLFRWSKVCYALIEYSGSERTCTQKLVNYHFPLAYHFCSNPSVLFCAF